nr:hypothetical protein [Tanacetum cinerariifolium]
MENSKKGYTLMIEKPDYRKSQVAKTPGEQNPGEIHWAAVKAIFKYLRNIKDMVLVYGVKLEAELKVSCYADAKAEYIAAAEASMEVVWMRKFIDELGGVMPSNKRPIEMLCDNEPAIVIANDPDDNVVDPFTKPMSYDKHYEHAMAIEIVPARSLM